MYAMKGRNVRKGAKKEVRDIKNLTANRKLATKMRHSIENITNTTKELFRYSETNKSQLRSIICNTYDIDIRNSNKNSCIVYYYLHGDFFCSNTRLPFLYCIARNLRDENHLKLHFDPNHAAFPLPSTRSIPNQHKTHLISLIRVIRIVKI